MCQHGNHVCLLSQAYKRPSYKKVGTGRGKRLRREGRTPILSFSTTEVTRIFLVSDIPLDIQSHVNCFSLTPKLVPCLEIDSKVVLSSLFRR